MTEPHVAVLSQVQQFLDRQHGLYIDGRPGPAQSEKRLAIFDPATGQEIAPYLLTIPIYWEIKLYRLQRLL